MSQCPRTFFGKYRGTVANNVDPQQTGRVQVIVPDVSAIALTSWAMPCTPIGGPQMGMFTVPQVGTGIWVEFEQGDPDYPVWVGNYWGSAAEVPALSRSIPPTVPGITLQTPAQNGIVVSDVPGPTGGVLITTPKGAVISVSDQGIFITNGKGATISLMGKTVDINGGALTIT